jgi:photosystem II stability/assembly factor-like uncharacterized protein
MHRRLVTLAAAFGLALAGRALVGQSTAPAADPFADLHFRSIGPAVMSGRVTDFAVYETNPAIYYVATAHSGLWKTINHGTTFVAQFQDQGLMSIGDVAVSQKTPDLVWIGAGEANNRQSTSWGDGIYKSIDGGRTFRNMGLRQSFHINRIVIDPNDSDVVFVAAGGSLFGPGGDRGVYRTIDAGATWKRVLDVDADTGANEVVMDPTNNRILYASTYQRRRSQCCFNGGGPGSGLWKSTDAGETWTRLTTGVPAGSLGRIGLDIYRKSPNILYALIEAEGGGGGGRGAAAAAAAPAAQGGGSGLYRSDDAGASWHRISATNPRPMYFSQIRIDPNNPDRLLIANVQVMLSTDGGRTFAQADATIHDDTHPIWWDPANSDHIMIGTDGGVGVSWDGTKRWTFLSNLPIGLFYHVGFDFATPFNVCGGMQDNDAWCGPSAVRNQRGISQERWSRHQIGDGMSVIADALDSQLVYSSTQDGSIQRKNVVTGESKSIRPGAANTTPAPAAGEAFRFNWDTPMVFSPHDPHVLIVGGNRVFRSPDRGDTWAVISSDLTANATRDDLTIMGVKDSDVRISRNDGIGAWPTIVSVAESPKQPGVYYTGTDDGVVSVSKDGGRTWDKTLAERMPGFPKGAWVSEVVPSRYDAGTVYVTVDAHRVNDFDTHLWGSRDFGATFESIAANLKGEVIKTLTEDQRNPDVLYLGAETGLFLSINRGKSWQRLKGNFPTVRVDEITLHPRDNAMLIATHGRAIWILDHLEPIQEYAAAQAATDARLFSVPPALEWRPTNELNMEFWGDGFFLGENPSFEAVIPFYLTRAAADVKLKITDAAGKDVRALAVVARNPTGLQTACWDMRVEPLPAAGAATAASAAQGRAGAASAGAASAAQGRGGGRGAVAEEGPSAGFASPCGGGGRGGGGGFGGGGGGGNAGPHVLPGSYNVSLLVDGRTIETKTMKVVADPEVRMTELQRKRYFDIAMELHDMQRRGDQVAAALGTFFTQMTDVAAKLPGAGSVPAAVKTQFAALSKELDAVRVKFGVPQGAAGGAGRGGAAAGAASAAQGRGGGRGGGAADPQNLLSRTSALKTQILAFWELPGEALMKQHAELKTAMPRAVTDANAVFMRAGAVSQALKKYDITLTVPSPIK